MSIFITEGTTRYRYIVVEPYTDNEDTGLAENEHGEVYNPVCELLSSKDAIIVALQSENRRIVVYKEEYHRYGDSLGHYAIWEILKSGEVKPEDIQKSTDIDTLLNDYI